MNYRLTEHPQVGGKPFHTVERKVGDIWEEVKTDQNKGKMEALLKLLSEVDNAG